MAPSTATLGIHVFPLHFYGLCNWWLRRPALANASSCFFSGVLVANQLLRSLYQQSPVIVWLEVVYTLYSLLAMSLSCVAGYPVFASYV